MAKVKSELNIKAISGVWVIILASNWVKTVVICLLNTFVVWLVMKSSHITDLALR